MAASVRPISGENPGATVRHASLQVPETVTNVTKHEAENTKSVTILNRIITLETTSTGRQIVYEVDQRHVQILRREFGLDGPSVKGVTSPCDKSQKYLEVRPLANQDATLFRSGTMRLVYIAADLPQLQFPAHKPAYHAPTYERKICHF